MKTILFILFTCSLLAGCSGNHEANQNNDTKAASPAETETLRNKDQTEEATSAAKGNNLEGNWVNETEADTTNTNSSSPSSTLTDTEKKLLRIPTIPIETPYGEDGDIRYEHTEKEIVDDYMDEDGRIYFALDEKPVRTIITGENGNIHNITNYGDAFIELLTKEAYELTDQAQIDDAYQLILSATPAQLQGQELTYRSYEEATNLERGITKLMFLVAPTLNDLDYIIKSQAYDHDALPILLEELESLGSPNVLPPAPQTGLDLQIFENMKAVQGMWGQLGQFEDPNANRTEFEQLYYQIRKETLYPMARVNYTLSEDI